jgi:AcrR family transcriptional regulator
MSTALVSRSTGVDVRVTDAALALFDQHGYDGVDELDIALRAGITVAELQERFAGKQEVLGTIVDRATDTLFWYPIDVDALAPSDALERLMREHLRLIAVDERIARVVIREHRHLENPYRRSWATRTGAYRERWRDAVGRMRPDWPEDEVEIAVLATLHALNTAVDPRANAERLVAFAHGFFRQR